MTNDHQIDVPLLSPEKEQKSWSRSLEYSGLDVFCQPQALIILTMLSVIILVLLTPTPIRIPDSIQVDAFTVSSFEIFSSNITLSSSQLTAKWIIDYSYGRKYEHDILSYMYSTVKACVSLNHNGVTICSDSDLGPFPLYDNYHRNKIHIEIVASSLSVNPHVAESIIFEKKKTGVVVFTLNLNASFIKDAETVDSVIGSCEDIPVEFLGNSTFGRLYRAPISCLIN